MSTHAYNLQPRLSVLRWLSDIGSDLPDDVRLRLAGTLAASTFPAVLGSVNSTCIALTAYTRSGNGWLLMLAFLDLAVLGLRIGGYRSSIFSAWAADILVLSGLAWALVLAASTSIIVLSDDWPMSIVIVATALGSCAGIIARNYAAIRLATLQIILIDLSFKVPFVASHLEFLPLLLIQGVAFPYVAVWIMQQQRRTTVLAISGELESRRQSMTDPLTGLFNRRGFTEAVGAMTRQDSELALFYLDLDGFKCVNDRLGHAAGDDLLREVARRLITCAPTGAVCRPGGDEFLVVMRLEERSDARAMSAIMKQSIGMPCVTGAGSASVGVSIGFAFFTSEPGSLQRALAEADEALYRIKAENRSSDDGRDACPVDERPDGIRTFFQRQKR